MALADDTITAPATTEAPRSAGLINFLRQHPTGFWFIFWGEFAERCSYYGMRAILATYMAYKLGFGEANAATFNSFFIAACYFLPLVGGYLADNFFGKYRIIVAFSVPYILGHVVLGVEEPLYLFIALVLLAMGSGVIKPNISTLMGMTYDQQRPGQEQLKSTAFSMFYMAINIGAAISQFAIPDIKEAYGYQIAFLFPAVLMAAAFVIFAIGKKYYAVETIERKRTTPEEFMLKWQILGRIGGLFLLVVFFWAVFDQASSTWIFFANTYMDCRMFGHAFTPEKMQALNPVLIVLLLPPVTYLWVVLDRRKITIRATDKIIVGFLLTGLCMGVMALAGFMAGEKEKTVAPRGVSAEQLASWQKKEPYADFILEDQIRRLGTSDPQKLRTALEGMGLLDYCQEALYRRQALPTVAAGTIGLLASPMPLSPVEAVVSAAPPRTMVDYVRPENRVSIWWQALAYFVITIAEILISVTGLELAYTAAPKNMKSFVTALWLLTVFVANLAINAPLARLYPVMHPGSYFLMFTIIMLVVTAAFFFVARRFNRVVAAAAAVTGVTAEPGEDGALISEQMREGPPPRGPGTAPSEGIQDRRKR